MTRQILSFLILCIAVFITFPTFGSEISQSPYIYPEICHAQAKEQKILRFVEDSNDYDRILQKSFTWGRTFDISNIKQRFETAFVWLANDLNIYNGKELSPTANYLYRCLNDERECHQFFSTEHGKYQEFYCDFQFYKTSIEDSYDNFNRKSLMCGDLAEFFFSSPVEEDPRYQKLCFDKSGTQINYDDPNDDSKDGSIQAQYRYLDNLKFDFHRMLGNLVKKYVQYNREVFLFVLFKVIDDFDRAYTSEESSKLTRHYNMVSLVEELTKCQDNQFHMYKYDTLGKKMYTEASLMYQQLAQDKNQSGRFSLRPELLSDPTYYFDLVNKFYTERTTNRSYENWSLTDQIHYFANLEEKKQSQITAQPIDSLTYAEIANYINSLTTYPTNDAKKPPQASISTSQSKPIVSTFVTPSQANELICNDVQSCHGDGVGATTSQTKRFNDIINSNDLQKIEGLFTQNETFRMYFLSHLFSLKQKTDQYQFDETKPKYYNQIHHGHLPYHFLANALGDLKYQIQKFNQSYVEASITGSLQQFRDYFYKEYCIKQRSEYEDFTVKEAYCYTYENDTQKQAEKLHIFEHKTKEFYDQLVQEIKTDQLTFYEYDYASIDEKLTRSHIYTEEDALLLNGQMRKINDFCYTHMVKLGKFAAPQEDIQTLYTYIDKFSSIALVHQLLGYSHFTDMIQLSPSQRLESNCFEKGFVFGDDLDHTAGGKFGQLLGHYEPNRQTWYKPSNFSVSLNDLHDMEDSIYGDYVEEIEKLAEAPKLNNEGNQRDFLLDSILGRTGALIDYAKDHPSYRTGQHICDLLKQADLEDFEFYQRVQTINTCAMIASFALLPTRGFGLKAFFYYGAYYFTAGVFVATHQWAIWAGQEQEGLVNTNYHTNFLTTEEAQQLHEEILSMTKDHKLARNLSFLFLIPTYSSIENFILRNRTFVSKAMREIYRKRQKFVEEFLVKRTKGTGEAVVKDVGFLKDNTIRAYIFNVENVTAREFEDIMLQYSLGHGDDYIRATFGRKVFEIFGTRKYLPKITKIEPKPIQPNLLQRTTQPALKWVQGVAKPVTESKVFRFVFENSIWAKKFTLSYTGYGFLRFLSLKQWGWQKTVGGIANALRVISPAKYKDYFGYSYQVPFDIETRMVNLFNKASEYSSKTGNMIFPPKMYENLGKQLQYYKKSSSKVVKFIPKIDVQRQEFLEKIVAQIKTKSDRLREKIREYLEPMIHGELLTTEEFLIFGEHFTKRIETLSDCKDLLKVLKFSNREYSLARDQFFFKGKNLLNPRAYQNRRLYILQHADEFFEIARYARHKMQIRFYQRVKQMVDDSNGVLNIDEIDRVVKEAHKEFPLAFETKEAMNILKGVSDDFDEFSINFISRNRESLEARIKEFEDKLFPQYFGDQFSQSLFESLLSRKSYVISARHGWLKARRMTDAFPKHVLEKEFLELEAVNSAHFHRFLEKGLKKYKNDIKKAYEYAYNEAKFRKAIEYECASPRSEVRLMSNRIIKKWTQRISMATYSTGYSMNHWDEPKDLEFATRLMFEVGLPTIAARLRVNVFTRKDQTPFWKTFGDWEKMAGETALYDALGLITLDTLFWGHDAVFESERTRDEFYERIIQSGNPLELLNSVMNEGGENEELRLLMEEKYNQVAKNINQLYARYDKGEFQSDNELVDEAIKLGLIDELFDKSDSPNLTEEEMEQDDALEEELLDNFAEVLYQENRSRKEEYANYYGLKPDADDFLSIPPTFTIGAIAKYGDEFNIMRSQEWEFLDPLGMSDTFHDAINRYMFYRVWDAGFYSWSTYLRTHLMYKALCKWRFAPIGSPLGAIAVYAAFKATLDPITFYVRKKTTGY
ncbi:MAG: ATP-binding protein [Bdellovibrionales bacterium]|nr:ATP-binding protein [Bdellovibrionales bacterium]